MQASTDLRKSGTMALRMRLATRFDNRGLSKQFQEVEQLPAEDKNGVEKLLDVLSTKKQLQPLPG